MTYPLEARLRPAHELRAAAVSALAAALVLFSPGLFGLPPSLRTLRLATQPPFFPRTAPG